MQPTLLLVIPPCFTRGERDFEIGFPINLALLGQVARGLGWAVDYLDMTLEEKEGQDGFALLDRRLATPDLGLVGISDHTVRTSVTTRAVAERVKELRHGLPVVVGGVNATFMWRELLDGCAAIDGVLRGYAQPGLRSLLASLQSRSGLASGPSGPVPGLAMRREDGFRLDPLEPPVAAEFACLSWEGLEVERYLRWTRTYPLLTQTGCGFACNFCTSVMPGPYQNREVYFPADQVVGEMERAIALGFVHFFMSANLFTSNRERCLALCAAFREAGVPEAATWSCMTRVELVDDEVLAAMRAAGCIDIAFGIETASREQWRSLRKGLFSADRVQRAFDDCRRAGLSTTAYLMLGAPEQTEQDVEATVQLVRELDPDYRVVSFFQPFPGTPYWNDFERFGLSEVAPLEEWNFHEAPICRTRHFSKASLLRAAVRLHLDRGEEFPLDPEADALRVDGCPQGLAATLPEPAREALALADGSRTIAELLERITRRHGLRGQLIALYTLSAGLREGWVRTARPEDSPIRFSSAHLLAGFAADGHPY